jgi:hypothetical protein
MAPAMAKSSDTEGTAAPKIVRLRRIEDMVLVARITGATPVIPHKWSEKSIRQMADKQQAEAGAARPRRLPKNPEEEALDSCYWLDDQGAIPAVSFKAAMVGACRFFDGLTMTLAKLLFYVEGEGPEQLVPVGDKSNGTMREDTPRNSSGTPDLRYRYQFWPWQAELRVHYLPSMIDVDSVIALLDAAGKGGVGDWRPSSPKSSTGSYGQFRVEL